MTGELSLEALSLLCTVYPLGIGLLMLEVFRMKGTPRVRLKGGIYSRASALGLTLLAWPAFFATVWSFGAVLNDVTVDGWAAALIRIAGTLLGIGITYMLVELTWAARALDTTSGGESAVRPQPAPLAPPKTKPRKRRKRR